MSQRVISYIYKKVWQINEKNTPNPLEKFGEKYVQSMEVQKAFKQT